MIINYVFVDVLRNKYEIGYIDFEFSKCCLLYFVCFKSNDKFRWYVIMCVIND